MHKILLLCSSSFPRDRCELQTQKIKWVWIYSLENQVLSPCLMCSWTGAHLYIYRDWISANTVWGCPWLQLCCPEFGVMQYILFQFWIKCCRNALLGRKHMFLLFFSFSCCLVEALWSRMRTVGLPKEAVCIFSLNQISMFRCLTYSFILLSSSCLGSTGIHPCL